MKRQLPKRECRAMVPFCESGLGQEIISMSATLAEPKTTLEAVSVWLQHPWPDVLQLNAFELDLRAAIVETLSSIAQQCDGVRCDMAMLVLNSIFARTWSGRAGQRPATEYWVDVISAIKKRYPGFLFIAEAYWGREWELLRQDFDCCYDK